MRYIFLILFSFSVFADLHPSGVEPNLVRKYGQDRKGKVFKEAWTEGYNECRVDLLNAFYFHTEDNFTKDSVIEVINQFTK